MRHPALIALLAWLVTLPAAADAPCGDPAGACSTAHGFYQLALPAGASGSVPAMVYLHGWGGSSDGVMQRPGLRDVLAARGYALIAPEGVPSTPGRTERGWSLTDGRPPARDDLSFLAEVLDDAARHGVDRGRILMAGFSRGASMVWEVACHAPDLARAYVPIAGAFWEPLPAICDGPVDLFQTHGWTDRTVPLEGRKSASGALTQGDVFASLKILRSTMGCDPDMPDSAPMEADGNLWLRHWGKCPGGRLDLMLHPGAHVVPEGWTTRALDWFEALPAGG